MHCRDADRLGTVIKRAENGNMEGKLDIPLKTAEEFLAELRHLEALRQPITAKAVSQARSMKSPPLTVCNLLLATMMVLGEDEKKAMVRQVQVTCVIYVFFK